MLQIKSCKLKRQNIGKVITILVLMCSGFVSAEDPDFDYLPPDEPSILKKFSIILSDMFFTPHHPGSYTSAKKFLYSKIKDTKSFYCDCNTDLVNRTFDKKHCNYIPKKDNARAHRLEAEHVLPAFWIAKFHPNENCWQARESCGSARECCLKNSDRFKKAHNDLVNLFPSIGELNGNRSNFLYDILENENRNYGSCDFEVDSLQKLSEPKDDIRGDIARIYYYMRDTYDLQFPAEITSQLSQWSLSDPISQKELDRDMKVRETQGSSNSFIHNRP